MIYKSYLLEQDKKILNTFNLILFYGENSGLKKEFKNHLKTINNKASCLNYFQDEILKDFDNFYNEINNKSLFEEEKIFFVNGVTDKFYDIISDIENKIVDHKIILFADNLDKKSKIRNYFEKLKKSAIVPCYLDNEITLKKLLSTKLNGYTGITNEAINLILQQTNMDRLSVNNEIDKIKSFCVNKNITINDLEKLLDQKENENFNFLKDNALNGDKKNTNKLLSDTVFEPDKNILYLSLINQRLNQISEFKNSSEKDPESALNKLRPQIFWKDKPNFLKQISKWNKEKIKQALRKSYDLELKIKSDNVVKKELLIKEFVIDLCKTANSL